jgi:hypothetical protein
MLPRPSSIARQSGGEKNPQLGESPTSEGQLQRRSAVLDDSFGKQSLAGETPPLGP